MTFTEEQIAAAKIQAKEIIYAANQRQKQPAAAVFLQLFIEAAYKTIDKRAADPNTTTLVPPDLTCRASRYVARARGNQNIISMQDARRPPRIPSPAI